MLYLIELFGRDGENEITMCIVKDADGKELASAHGILTEVVLLDALRIARGGGSQELEQVCERLGGINGS